MQAIKPDATTVARQTLAADPAHSAWVSANAGSGKTFVLARRVIRLMLAGNDPSKILCLTFTKTAAANMASRVFEELSKWTMMDDAALKTELTDVLQHPPTTKEMGRARELFALSLDTPGGLKIQTIHAFCEALLHQFALEANVPAHFRVADDTEKESILSRAREQAFLSGADNPRITEALRVLLFDYSEDKLSNALDAFIAKQYDILEWLGGDVDAALAPIHAACGLAPNDGESEILEEAFTTRTMSDSDWREVLDLSLTDKKGVTNVRNSGHIANYLEAPDGAAYHRLRAAYFLTKDNELKSKLAVKPVSEDARLHEMLTIEGEHLRGTLGKLEAAIVLKGSRALFVVGQDILARYQRAKLAAGLVDYDDMINKTATLLTKKDIAQWVQYKLDRGIDHVLVDEAQDTSPQQWKIITALISEFFAGESISLKRRTMFAVGDQKQSIYSFQGARPEEFSEQRTNLKLATKRVEQPFKEVGLAVSFRSVQDILSAVDIVFNANDENKRGLGEDWEPHSANRQSARGEVQVWDLFMQQNPPLKTSWLDPLDSVSQDDSAVLLAEKITAEIKRTIGQPLSARGRSIEPGDFLILVRKRDKFAKAITRSLKTKGVPVSGADRLKLSEHIAVEDLTALGKFVSNTSDDLSLAAVLKSPLFAMDEAQLLELANGRGNQSLYGRLGEAANEDENGVLATLKKNLAELIDLGARLPVFDFYSHVLSNDGGRRKLLKRLGAEAEDLLDAFMNQALEFERNGALGLDAFLQSISENTPEIKREMDAGRNEVRIMTTHAAKGLEAPIVFLVDPCTAPYSATHRPTLYQVKTGNADNGWLWHAVKPQHFSITLDADKHCQRLAEEEYNRLLYVGMTRAEDRLIVCGYANSKYNPDKLKYTHWQLMVKNALAHESEPLLNEAGESYGIIYRLNPEQRDDALAVEAPASPSTTPELPDWLYKKARHEKPLPRPLSPSGLFTVLNGEVEPISEANIDAGTMATALARGNATHRLLQYLPAIDPKARVEMASAYLAQYSDALSESQQNRIKKEVLAILSHPDHGRLFVSGSSAEVAISGTLKIRGKTEIVSGQVDRLLVSDNEVLIVDFKTNRSVPATPDTIPKPYITQMAIYRELLQAIYPEHRVRPFLLWTVTGQMNELSDDLLDDMMTTINHT